jgi:hypothetical protein
LRGELTHSNAEQAGRRELRRLGLRPHPRPTSSRTRACASPRSTSRSRRCGMAPRSTVRTT